VCVRERERMREKEKEWERERERKKHGSIWITMLVIVNDARGFAFGHKGGQTPVHAYFVIINLPTVPPF
jgi:hypothetical protein